MTDARDEILRRIRTALGDHPDPAPVPREYRSAGAVLPDRELFVERVQDYRATVTRDATTTDVLRRRGIERVVVPDGFPAELRPAVEVVAEPVDAYTLDEVGSVVSTCRVAIAETGTIVLDAGPGMGPRALTLVPDYHLVVVRAEQVVAGVPDALPLLDPARPLTWISGPSATSDIELDRVEGVHGPRTLDVLLIT
jgi:L-lactate dehydrogenase complex protein LldG